MTYVYYVRYVYYVIFNDEVMMTYVYIMMRYNVVNCNASN